MQKADIINRLRDDFLLVAELMLRIQDKEDVGRVIPFRLNSVQMDLFRREQRQLKEKGRSRIIILKGRQGGITTLNCGLNFHQAVFNPHSRVLTLAHKGGGPDDPLAMIFGISRRFVDEWPEKYKPFLPALSEARKHWLDFYEIDSRFITGTAGSRGVGRGITLNRVHGSEYAFWKELKTVLKAIHPALDRPGTAVMLESTAGAYESEAHTFWKEAAHRLHPYEQAFYPWWETDFASQLWRELEEPFEHRDKWPDVVPDELAPLGAEEIDIIRRSGIEPERLKWRRAEIRQSGLMEFLQEYAEDPESCWLVGGDLVLAELNLKTLLDRAIECAPPPALKEHFHGGELRWHIHPNLINDRCVLGCDVSQGTGNDESAFEVRTVSDFKLVCRYSSNKIPEVPELADLIARVGDKCNKAFLVIESNGPGLPVLRRLSRQLAYGNQHIYHREADLARKRDKRSRSLGWRTDNAAKHLIVGLCRETFTEALNDELEPPTPECVRDAFALVRDADDPTNFDLNGKDALVAYALTCFGRLKMLARSTDDSIVKLPR